MTRSRLLPLAIAALALALVAPVVLLMLAGAESPSPEPDGSGSPNATEAVRGPVPADIAWVYAPPPGAGAEVDSYVLQAGTLEAEEPIVDLEVEWHADLGADIARRPAVGPPIDGSVVYVADDGAATEVHRAQIAPAGRDELLAELDDVAWDLAVSPDGSVAYAALVERGNTEHDLGVVRVLLDGSGAVEPLMPPAQLAGRPSVTRVAFISFNVELAVSPDGRHLVRRACVGSEGCLTELVDLATGLTHALPEGEVVGVAAGAIVMHRCDVDGCALEATDLETGAIAQIDGEPMGSLIAVHGRPVFINTSNEGQQPTIITATDLASGERQVLHRAPEGGQASIGLHFHLALALPENFVHVTESVPVGELGAIVNVRQRELLISLEDGHVVEIPPAPFRPPPGFDSQG